MQPVHQNIDKLKSICQNVTHVFYTSYAHSDDFKGLPERNVPLFRGFMDVIDAVCPRLQRVCIYTGGKVQGARIKFIPDYSSINDIIVLWCSPGQIESSSRGVRTALPGRW